MDKVTAKYLNDLLYEKDEFIIKYHFGEGIDLNLLDKLYDCLEELKGSWVKLDNVPKDIVYKLVQISPALYGDLSLYIDKEGCEDYEEIIYNISGAIEMCLNANEDDPFFDKPLKDCY